MLSLSYIFAVIFGAVFLNEYLKITQIIGLSIIIVGVVLIGGGMLNSFILCVILTLFGALGGYFFKRASRLRSS